MHEVWHKFWGHEGTNTLARVGAEFLWWEVGVVLNGGRGSSPILDNTAPLGKFTFTFLKLPGFLYSWTVHSKLHQLQIKKTGQTPTYFACNPTAKQQLKLKYLYKCKIYLVIFLGDWSKWKYGPILVWNIPLPIVLISLQMNVKYTCVL